MAAGFEAMLLYLIVLHCTVVLFVFFPPIDNGQP